MSHLKIQATLIKIKMKEMDFKIIKSTITFLLFLKLEKKEKRQTLLSYLFSKEQLSLFF